MILNLSLEGFAVNNLFFPFLLKYPLLGVLSIKTRFLVEEFIITGEGGTRFLIYRRWARRLVLECVHVRQVVILCFGFLKVILILNTILLYLSFLLLKTLSESYGPASYFFFELTWVVPLYMLLEGALMGKHLPASCYKALELSSRNLY